MRFVDEILIRFHLLHIPKAMDSFRKKIELAADIAIVGVSVLLCIVLVKNHLLRDTTVNVKTDHPISSSGTKIGERIDLPEVDWQKNRQTLLLALSTTCHFCSESTPFYQQLAKERNGETHIIAVFPQAVNEGKEYLNEKNVFVDDIKQADLNSIGVNATPTVILTDDKGIARGVWIGKLPNSEETKVINRMRQSIAEK